MTGVRSSNAGERAMAESDHDRFTAADGTSIAYWVTGAGTPVILLHGYPVTSATNFATHYASTTSAELIPSAGPTIESALVAAGVLAVRFDRRGCGRSDRPHSPERYRMAIFADDVRSLVSHLGIGRAALVGYSFGAWIC
jgi:pimeloyl-ACP methyl ester carboxylesterase